MALNLQKGKLLHKSRLLFKQSKATFFFRDPLQKSEKSLEKIRK